MPVGYFLIMIVVGLEQGAKPLSETTTASCKFRHCNTGKVFGSLSAVLQFLVESTMTSTHIVRAIPRDVACDGRSFAVGLGLFTNWRLTGLGYVSCRWIA